MKRLGVYMVEVQDMIGLTTQNISQHNVGFNQKMLGASKYFAMDPRQYGGTIDFLKAFYNRGNWTPFMFMERRLKRHSRSGRQAFDKRCVDGFVGPRESAVNW